MTHIGWYAIKQSPNSLGINPYLPSLLTSPLDGTIYPTPPLGQDMTQGQFLSGV